MSYKPKLQIFLYRSGPIASFKEALAALGQCPVPFELYIIGDMPQDEANSLMAMGMDMKPQQVRVISSGAVEPWHCAAAVTLKNSFESDHVLLLASSVRLDAEAVPRMLERLKADSQLAGVSPALLYADEDGARAASLGIVADSQGALHDLYTGMPAQAIGGVGGHRFQFAAPRAMLIRTADLLYAGSFGEQYNPLELLGLCLRLSRRRPGKFVVDTGAIGYTQPSMEDMIPFGVWNSYVLHGKIEPGLVRPDYFKIAKADGFAYAATEWLHETIAPADDWQGSSLWLAWRRDPCPATLLRWLASLRDGASIIDAMSHARNMPAFMPLQFRHYEVLARRINYFASRNGIRELADAAGQWQKRARSFHYRQLMPGMKMLLEAGLYNASLDICSAAYDAWLEIDPVSRPAQVKIDPAWPKIAVVMPVYNANPAFLRQAIDSVLRQSYANWELCIADDASQGGITQSILREYAANDPRIKVAYRQRNGHICEATNTALELVTAPYAAFLDHDDLLAPDALACVAAECAAHPDAVLIYSDSDHVDADNVRRSPWFKPDFEPVRSEAYHLCVYATKAVARAGGMRAGTEGSQDQDLCLRITENCKLSRIRHIPRILYHWRIHADSTAMSLASKPYVLKATYKVKRDAAIRRGLHANVTPTCVNNAFQYEYALPEYMDCAVVLLGNLVDAKEELADCLRPLLGIRGASIFWQPMDSGINPSEGEFDFWPDLKVLDFAGLHWTQAINNAMRKVRARILFFLEASLEVKSLCRPEQLPIMAALDSHALAGGQIWHWNSLENAGYFPDITGEPFPLLRGMSPRRVSQCCNFRFVTPYEVIGCSWQCMAIDAKTMRTLGGFDESMGAWAAVDFCLRAQKLGKTTIVSPWGGFKLRPIYAREWLEEVERQAAPGWRERFLAKWGDVVARHPLRNANLRAAPDYGWMLRINT